MGKTTKDNKKDTAEFLEGIISEWRTVFDSITDMVSVLDTDHRFIRVNRPLAEYLGVEPQDVIGKKCYEVMHGTDKPVSYCPIAKSTNIKQPVHKEVYDSALKKYFMISLSPIMGENGKVQRIVHVMRDITDRKQWEGKLQLREKQLSQSQQAAKLGSWEWDITSNVITWSDELFNIFGVKPSEFEVSYEAFLSMVHPDDKDRLDSAVKDTLSEHGPYNIDVRIMRSDGSEWIMEARGDLTLDENGNPVKMGGTAQDITGRKKIEEDLRSRGRFIESLINLSPDIIYIYDLVDKKNVYSNDGIKNMLGYSVEDIKKMGDTVIPLLMHPNDLKVYLKETVPRYSKTEDKERIAHQYRMKHKNGNWHWLESVEIIYKRQPDGSPQQVFGVIHDITDRKNAEIELKESEEKYRKLIETSNDAIFLADAESGIILDANIKSEELLGIPLEKIKGMHQTKLHPEEKLEQYREIFNRHVREENAFISDLLVVHKSGRNIPVDISASMIELGGRKILQGVFRDITNRKKAEEDLIIKNRAIESSLSAVGITDAEGNLLYVNDSLLRMWGYENKDEVLGRVLTEFWDGNRIYKTIENTLKKGGDIGEDKGKRKDGSLFDVQFSSSLIKDKDGRPQYFFGSFLDITERRKAEDKVEKYHNELEGSVKERTRQLERAIEALKKEINERKEAEGALLVSEERFRIAATTMTDLIWEGDVRDNSLNWYGDIDRYLGYEEGEFPRTISGHMESIHTDDREGMIKSIGNALETGDDFRAEYRIRCNDGTYRYWDETGKSVEYENGKPVRWIGSVSDITDRKIIEAQILKSEEQFKKLSQEFNALLDAIPDNITLLDSDLKILWANKASAHKFQKDRLPLEGQHCYKLYCNASTPCEHCPVMASSKSGREETVRRLSRSGIVWDIRAFPIKDDEGNVNNVIEVARDVSVRVKLEQEAGEIQAKLIHTNKMTSLGTLVSGVAHEINNPNSFIMTNADLFADIWKDAFKLLNKLDDEYKNTQVGGVSFSDLGMVAPKLLRGIYDGSERIKSIIDNLRDFARSDRSDLDEKVDINKAVRTASNILNSHIKQYTDNYYIACKDNIPFIKGNSRQIEQVVINLIINSLQALTNRQSCVIVSTYHDNENDLVIIKVEDEGTGISESDMDRITEPFFTTKMESGGTGLGLSISYAVIKDHKGFLEFRSEKNKRTIALIKLPAFSNHSKD